MTHPSTLWYVGKYKTTKTILHQSYQTIENKLIYITYTYIHKGSSVVKVHGSLMCLPFSYSILFYTIYTHTYIHTNTHTHNVQKINMYF